MSIRSLVVGTAGSLLLAVGALAPGVAPAAAASGDPYETTTTYTVDPERHEVGVVVDLVPTAARLALDGPDVDHQFHVAAEQVGVWIADVAVDTTATLAGAELTWSMVPSATADPAGYHQIAVSVPAYHARTIRHVTVAFTIPSADIRSSDPTRVLADYVHLCVHANGPLDGRVVVQAPVGFALDPLDGPPLFGASVVGGASLLDSGSLGEPQTWSTCFSLLNPAQDHVATVVTGGGSVTLRAWPGDAAWQARVTSAVENAVPALVAFIGRPIPRIAGLVIREAVVTTGYEGRYGSADNAIVLSESITTDSITNGSITVAHELAHAWFNHQTEGATWLSEGTAEWAARSVINGAVPCRAPRTADANTLRTWKYVASGATQVEVQAVLDQYDTACAIVTRVAAAAGPVGTRLAIGALLDRRDPYGATTPVDHSAVTWRDWLDAMDELGVHPNGGPEALAGSLLLEYGVATSEGELRARIAARSDYHDLIRHASPWYVPTAVRDALSAWRFSDAETAIKTARDAFDAVAQADLLVPGSHASAGPIRVQWESARTQDDLDAVLALAQAQRGAAKDVADAMAPLQSPLGFVPWVGSLGSTSTTLTDAQAAVGADNPAAAEAAAIALRAEMLRYEQLGRRRIAIAAIVAFNALVLLVLVVAALLSRRRRRRGAPLPEAPRLAAEHGVGAHASSAITLGPVQASGMRPDERSADGERQHRRPPAPPEWFASLQRAADGPPPPPILNEAQPLLPPMTTPPPGLPSPSDVERRSIEGGAIDRGSIEGGEAEPGGPPPPPAGR